MLDQSPGHLPEAPAGVDPSAARNLGGRCGPGISPQKNNTEQLQECHMADLICI